MLAGSTVLDAAAHGQRAERGEHPAHVLPQVAADRDRWSGRVAAEAGQARPRLQGELAGGTVGVRTGPAEIGDGDDDRPRELRQHLLRIDAQLGRLRPGGRHHDDVGAGELGAKIHRRRGHAALAGIEIAEQGRVGAGRDGRSACADPPQPIPLWRLDFPDVSTGIDQQLSAVAAGDAVADLDNADVRQRCRSAVVPVAQRVSVYVRRVVVYAILVNLPIGLRPHRTERLTSAAIMPLLLKLQYMEVAGAAAGASVSRSAAGIRSLRWELAPRPDVGCRHRGSPRSSRTSCGDRSSTANWPTGICCPARKCSSSSSMSASSRYEKRCESWRPRAWYRSGAVTGAALSCTLRPRPAPPTCWAYCCRASPWSSPISARRSWNSNQRARRWRLSEPTAPTPSCPSSKKSTTRWKRIWKTGPNSPKSGVDSPIPSSAAAATARSSPLSAPWKRCGPATSSSGPTRAPPRAPTRR